MESFDGLKLGDTLKCINDEDWVYFTEGSVYTVTDIWESRGFFGKAGVNIDLDGRPVACEFCSDFELYEKV